jgi:hypothetical protein
MEFREYPRVKSLPAAFDISGRQTQTRIRVTCPFCSAETDCYVWSLCGSGKKCSGKCGALLVSTGAGK